MIGLLKIFGLGRFAADLLREERQRGESLIDCLNRLRDEAAQWRAYGMSKPQPAPKNQNGPPIWPMIVSEVETEAANRFRIGTQEDEHASRTLRLVAADMQARHELGVKKYGVPLVANNGRDHLKDAYQEALDLVVYLRAHVEATGCGDHTYHEAMDIILRLRCALEDG